MLCNSKINNRPDKLLQSRLIKLAFSLVALAVTISSVFVYPDYYLYLTALTAVLISLCLLQAIKTLDAGEEAITYGGFANEILHHDFKAHCIENSIGETVIANSPAKELLKNSRVLDFLEENIAEGTANQTALYRLKTAAENLTAEKVTLELKRHSGNEKIFNETEWFEVSFRPIYLKRADIFESTFSIKRIKKETYLFWTLDNITAEKNMESIFQAEQKSLHDFLDDLPVALYVVDKDYTLEYANSSFAKLTGTPLEKISGTSLSSYLSTNCNLPPHQDLWKGCLHFINRDKKASECYIFQSSFREEQKYKMRGVVVSNLPSDKNLHQQIEDAHDKISWLFNNAPIGIAFFDLQGKILECNPSALKLFNTEKENLLHHDLNSFIKNEEQNNLRKCFDSVREHPFEATSVDIRLNLDNKKEVVASLYISSMKRFYAVENPASEGFVVYMIDATKQKNLEMQFAQAQKMQAIGQLAGGVAHDFNNLLTAMIGFTDLLLQRHGVGDPSFADLIQIKQNANRATVLVRQLLAFSRKQPLQPKLIDVTDNFAELSHMLKRILGEQITLKFHYGRDLGYIRVDPVQFSQVILNLAVNAKDAMNGSGTLDITTRTDILSENYQFGDDVIKPGEFVVIDVKDTGCGIPPENMNRIFDPFFSTKQNIVGSGTGLGLAMVYGIVRQTEGFIKVASEVGVGTTFSIYLPRTENNDEDTPENNNEVITRKNGTPVLTVQEKVNIPVAVSQKILLGLNISNTIDRSHTPSSSEAGKTRILFVEDEDSVRSFGIRALKKKGYDVVGCNSAENALDYISEDSRFNLLITDMVMPGISGAELTKIIKKKLPEIRVILASGYSEEIVRQELDNFDDFDFITKPYSLGDLTAKVFDVLNKDR